MFRLPMSTTGLTATATAVFGCHRLIVRKNCFFVFVDLFSCTSKSIWCSIVGLVVGLLRKIVEGSVIYLIVCVCGLLANAKKGF